VRVTAVLRGKVFTNVRLVTEEVRRLVAGPRLRRTGIVPPSPHIESVMHYKRIVPTLLLLVAAAWFLPSALVSIPEKQISVCRPSGITELQDLEEDSHLLAVHVEVNALYAANPDLTLGELISSLQATHESVQKEVETVDYYYRIEENGTVRRVCTLTTVVAVTDLAQILPVFVRVDETLDI
jgi:hypothetical protein